LCDDFWFDSSGRTVRVKDGAKRCIRRRKSGDALLLRDHFVGWWIVMRWRRLFCRALPREGSVRLNVVGVAWAIGQRTL